MADLGDALRAAAPPVDELDLAAVHARRAQLERRARAGRLVAGSAVLVLAVGAGAVFLRDGQPDDRLVPAMPATSSPVRPSVSASPSPTGTVLVPPPVTGPGGTPLSPATPPPASPAAPPRTVPPSSRPPTPSSTPSAPSPTVAPPFVGQTEPSEAPAKGLLTLIAVRVAHQPGFDRVVYEFAGEGLPGWYVHYVDRPGGQASGEPVAVAGSAYLEVISRGIAWTAPVPGAVEYGGGRVRPSGTVLVREAVPSETFEGDGQWFIGLDRQAPFRVTALSSPARLVVDIATG